MPGGRGAGWRHARGKLHDPRAVAVEVETLLSVQVHGAKGREFLRQGVAMNVRWDTFGRASSNMALQEKRALDEAGLLNDSVVMRLHQSLLLVVKGVYTA